MNAAHSRAGEFRKVGENLYRYSSSGIYYARFRFNGKSIHRSLQTSDRDLAKRRLQEEIDKASRVDLSKSKLTLSELLRVYDDRIAQYAPKTTATRRCIAKVFKETWPHGLDVPIKSVSTGQPELWLGTRRPHIRNSNFNEYARFVRHLFELAVKLRALPDSPARGIKGLKVETPIRLTPTWEQFQKIVESIRSQKFSDTGDDSADLVEFMGRAGVGTAECANIQGEHINFPGNRVTLYRKKTDTGYAIPIFPQALPLLKRLESNGQIATGQPVFRVKDPKKALAAACKRLGLPNFSPRSLRRCFITRCVELGIDFKTIAAWQSASRAAVGVSPEWRLNKSLIFWVKIFMDFCGICCGAEVLSSGDAGG